MRLMIYAALSMVLSGQIVQPGRDPVKDMQKVAQKEAAERNFKELKESAVELAELSKQLRNPKNPSFPIEATPLCVANIKLAKPAILVAEDIKTPLRDLPMVSKKFSFFRSLKRSKI